MSAVSETERERAIHALRESYARGDLDGEEFEQMLIGRPRRTLRRAGLGGGRVLVAEERNRPSRH